MRRDGIQNSLSKKLLTFSHLFTHMRHMYHAASCNLASTQYNAPCKTDYKNYYYRFSLFFASTWYHKWLTKSLNCFRQWRMVKFLLEGGGAQINFVSIFIFLCVCVTLIIYISLLPCPRSLHLQILIYWKCKSTS